MYPANRAGKGPSREITIREHRPRWLPYPPTITGGGCANIVLLVFVFQDQVQSFWNSDLRYQFTNYDLQITAFGLICRASTAFTTAHSAERGFTSPSVPQGRQGSLRSSSPCHTISTQPETPCGHVPRGSLYDHSLDHAWSTHLPPR